MKSFCISLERKKENWSNLISYFKKNNVNDISIFPAIDGKQITSYFQNDMTNVSPEMKNLIESFGGETMLTTWALYHLLYKTNRRDHVQLGSFGAIGCYLSHVLLWKKMIDENLPCLLIFEDDATFTNDFSLKIDKVIDNLPSDADILFLGVNANFNPQPYNNDFTIIGGQFFGTHGYIISNNGAKKMFQYLFPIEIQIDAFMSYQNIFKRLRLYVLKESICTQSEHSSSIQSNCYICQFNEIDIEKFNSNFFLAIILLFVFVLVLVCYLIFRSYFYIKNT